MQHIPKVGESLNYKGFSFIIEKADAKRVILVRIQVQE
jgi:Mg2+/Co2+ transporter CorC